MTLLRRTLYFAPAVGFGFSVVLALSDIRHGDIWVILQSPGVLVGYYISTIYRGRVGDVAMVIVNGLIYSGVLVIACGLVWLVRRSSRWAVVFCGIITVSLSRPYETFARFDAYARPRAPWSAFSAGLISIGALAIMLAFVPRRWIRGSREFENRVHTGWSLPIKLLTVFAVCAYLAVLGLYFVPRGWTLTPAFAFSICPACVLSITVDSSFPTVALFLAPLSAAVYGSLGAVFGFLSLIIENHLRR